MLAVMQPYFFPYLGYFQLIAASDRFVFLDDAHYIKGGWINRNRFRIGGKIAYLTVPVIDASPNWCIDEVMVDASKGWRHKVLRSFVESYARAPHVHAASDLLDRVVSANVSSVADVARRSVTAVLDFVGIERDVIETSRIYGNDSLRGSARIVDICCREKATTYLNAPGGRELYQPEEFACIDARLAFLEPELIPYEQGTSEYEGGLSILDVIAWNGPARTKEMIAAGRVVFA